MGDEVSKLTCWKSILQLQRKEPARRDEDGKSSHF